MFSDPLSGHSGSIDNQGFTESSMDYSVLKQFYSKNSFRNFSIKYVIEGAEFYNVNGADFKIESDQYLLAGKQSSGEVTVNSQKNVRGICIDLMPEIISEVAANFIEPGAAITDLSIDTFFSSTDFPENKYNAKTTHLGWSLSQLRLQITEDVSQILKPNKEFYYLISECLVSDHIPLHKYFQNLKTIKNSTKKDLFRKLLLAKEYIDSAFLLPIDIEKTAHTGGLSEYHFFRLFKTSFGISPYQYILNKRLLYAHQLLKTKHFTVSAAATSSGFGDIYNFSRAFKKKFGYPPSGVI